MTYLLSTLSISSLCVITGCAEITPQNITVNYTVEDKKLTLTSVGCGRDMYIAAANAVLKSGGDRFIIVQESERGCTKGAYWASNYDYEGSELAFPDLKIQILTDTDTLRVDELSARETLNQIFSSCAIGQGQQSHCTD